MSNFEKIIMASVVIVIMVFCSFFIFKGCNKQIIDTDYNYNYAYIQLPNGEVVEGKVYTWRDYNESDQLQIKIDGVTYLVHSSDCVLVYNPNL